MVLKTELCRFRGAKIYPCRGIRFIRSDSQVFLFVNSKCKRYFNNKLKPSKLTWSNTRSEVKGRVKKSKDEKKAKKAEVMSKTQKTQGKVAKGAQPKGAKLGGGGGKR
ncbi:hypothetical protein MKX03_028813 [Papaver bracteatum]|nr:hypothetical protein MKX03_028813 [Papaver bracteatum]